ncbi:MAG: hypothetical protein JO031_11200 [Ktedonobacteraceae bacterium]|nr:hypothetical protein [Ktedonobacteraceae bacterium]
MFSIFKKASTEQDVVLHDLTEEQLTQAAGGCYGNRDWDNRERWEHRHHHHHHNHHRHHHHHHRYNDHDWDDRRRYSNTSYSNSNTTYGGGHW